MADEKPINGALRGTHAQNTEMNIGKIINPEHEKFLNKEGWFRVDPEDGRPLNPLFVRRGANTINLFPDLDVTANQNRAITAINISFQNRFAFMPIQGSPYPSIQNMGSHDSEVIIELTIKSNSEEFREIKKIQEMLDVMARRALQYRPFIFSGKDIFAITQVAVKNKLLKACGLENFVLDAVQIMRDPDSVELVRVSLTLTENILNDERLSGYKNVSNRVRREELWDWFISKQWTDKPAPIIGYLTKLWSLYSASEAAWQINKTRYGDTPNPYLHYGDTQILGDTDYSAISLEVAGKPWFGKVNDEFLRKDVTGRRIGVFNQYAQVPFYTAKYIPEEGYLIEEFLERIVPKNDSKPSYVAFPIDPDAMINGGIGSAVQKFIDKWLLGTDTLSEGKTRSGVFQMYLQGKYGKAVKEAVDNYQKEINAINPTRVRRPEGTLEGAVNDQKLVAQINKAFNAYKKIVYIWNDAHKEYYHTFLLPNALHYLSVMYPDYFAEVEKRINSKLDNGVGTYKDLFLDRTPEINPYGWLDKDFQEELQKAFITLHGNTISYLETIKELARKPVLNPGGNDKYINHQLLSNNDKKEWTAESAETTAKEGIAKYYSAISEKQTINDFLIGLRYVSLSQFSIRKSFPTYALYFIEDESGGIIKSFQEFYGYNAVIDWHLQEAQGRPATLMVTISNIFGHLDALVFNEDKSEFTKMGINKEAALGGTQAVQHNETFGYNTEIVGDKRTDIQNIMLRPGTKILLKAGYDNNPDNLTTVFSGQVTEMTTGEVITLICQDWGSELLGVWDSETMSSPYDKSGFFVINQSKNLDVTSTATGSEMIKEMLHSINCKHLGSWQIAPQIQTGGVYAYTWQQMPILSAVTRDRQNDVIGGDRSAENIRPSIMPFLSVWGYNPIVKDVKYENRVMWEILKDLQLYYSNNIYFVRPYGWGDGTLYFGPPWGTYSMEDPQQVGNRAIKKELLNLRFEAFKRIINNNMTITVPDFISIVGNGHFKSNASVTDMVKLFRWFRYFTARAESISKASSTKEIPIADLLTSDKIFATMLFVQNNDVINEATALLGPDTEIGFTTTRSVPLLLLQNPVTGVDWVWSGPSPKLQNSNDKLKELFFKLINNTSYIGISDQNLFSDYQVERLLEYLLREINQVITNVAHQLAEEKYSQDPDNLALKSTLDYLNKTNIPVRKWHIVTSENHIISNQITLDTSFYNCVQIDKKHGTLKFDPNLHEERLRFYPEYESYETTMKGFMSMSLLGEQLKRMYRGELMLTGNPEIRPHDLVLIIDNVRQIYGVVEVDKVVHSMTLDGGFISIVTPALLTEVGDSTYAHAYQAFYTALLDDAMKLESRNSKLGNLVSTAAGVLHPELRKNLSALPVLSDPQKIPVNIIGGTVGGTVLETIVGNMPFVRWYYFSLQNNTLVDHVKTHPISITPLVKRGWPWVGGIDGAAGRTSIMQIGFDVIKTWSAITEALNVIGRITNNVDNTLNTVKTIRDIENNKYGGDGEQRFNVPETPLASNVGAKRDYRIIPDLTIVTPLTTPPRRPPE